MEHPFDHAVESFDSTTIVRLGGEIDMAGHGRLLSSLNATSGTVILDMGDVTFLDSSGLSVLVKTHRRLAEHAGSMKIRNPSQVIRRMLEVTALDGWIEADSGAQ